MHGLSATLLLAALLLAGPQVDAGLTADQEEEIVTLHNEARARVKPKASNMQDLTWNDDLARKAQGWADRCEQGHNPDRYINGAGPTLGENIAFSSRGVISKMVGYWEDEKKVYNYKDNSCNPDPSDPMLASCGHYTQMVWAETKEIGCGFTSGCSGAFKDRLVCNYSPAGNFIGEKPYEAKRKRKNRPSKKTPGSTTCED